ncbi:hypothetical protein KQX54_020994 [Cotesia glomerata]|uniref:Uncharacterized protein n=1 Tax=Cotesia glomerata TaxID=32391 RepID=A0AAV7JAC4_COTGL|nr:hypothetical protein KQX54_020994 [Cotesia glomerata]
MKKSNEVKDKKRKNSLWADEGSEVMWKGKMRSHRDWRLSKVTESTVIEPNRGIEGRRTEHKQHQTRVARGARATLKGVVENFTPLHPLGSVVFVVLGLETATESPHDRYHIIHLSLPQSPRSKSRRRYLALCTAYPALTLINALQTLPGRLIVLGKKANLPPLQLYVYFSGHTCCETMLIAYLSIIINKNQGPINTHSSTSTAVRVSYARSRESPPALGPPALRHNATGPQARSELTRGPGPSQPEIAVPDRGIKPREKLSKGDEARAVTLVAVNYCALGRSAFSLHILVDPRALSFFYFF